MRRALAGTALLAAVGSGASVAAEDEGMVQRDVVDVAAPPETTIREISVDNRLGDVRIEGGERDSVSVVALKRAPREEAIERLKVTLVPDPSGVLRIATSLVMGEEARPIPAGSVRVDLVVKAPRSARARARVWKGRIDVRHLDEGAELAANEGSIEVKDVAGSITAHVARGDHRYRAIFGALDARGIEGEMTLRAVSGKRLDISLHEGSVRGREVEVRSLSIITTGADVVLRGRAVRGGAMRIASYEGEIDVRLEAEAGLSVQAGSRRGAVRVAGSSLRGARAGRGRYFGLMPGAETPASEPAAVELSSRVGTIRLAVVQP